MKRWGTITLMLFAFVVGFVSTYSCGGGGSSSDAADYAPLVHTHVSDDIIDLVDNYTTYSAGTGLSLAGTEFSLDTHSHDVGDISGSIDADTLEGNGAADFALSVHSHPDPSSTQYISVSFLGGGYNWNMSKVAVDDDDNFANADTSIWWEGLSPSLIDSTYRGVVYADVQLPDGAKITEYGMVYYDETGDSHTVFSQLRRTPEKKGIALIKSTGIAFTPQYAWTTSIDPAVAVVDNSSYSYHIRAQMQGGLDMAVISAMVGYVIQ